MNARALLICWVIVVSGCDDRNESPGRAANLLRGRWLSDRELTREHLVEQTSLGETANSLADRVFGFCEVEYGSNQVTMYFPPEFSLGESRTTQPYDVIYSFE